MQTGRLNILQQVGLGVLSLPISLGVIAVLTFVPTYYAVDLGLGLTATGIMFAVGRMLDVITDPVVGHLSDETRSPLGKRLPWMIFGACIFCPAIYFVMSPAAGLSVLGLGLLIAIFFVGLTLIDLPYSAVGLEISPFLHERTLIAAVKAVFQVLGALAASIIILSFASNQGLALQYTAVVTIGLTLFGLLSFIGFTPYRNQQEQSFTRETSIKFSAFKAFGKISGDRDYKRLLLAFGLAQAGSAMSVGLTALLVLKQIKAPELTGAFIAILLVFSALALPIWVHVSKRIGKEKSWSLGLLTGSALMLTSFLFVGGNVWLFGIFCALFGLVVAGDVILPTTLLADIVSDKPDDTASNQAGAMLGFKNAVSKMGFVFPMLLAFPILGALGVEAAETLDLTQQVALLALYGFVPAVLRGLAWWALRSGMSAQHTDGLP